MQDYAVNDFSGGYMTNAAYHAGRQKSAQYLLDCRSQEQGWLIARKGYVAVASETQVSDVFAHKNILLAVIDGALKYARLGDPTATLTFEDIEDSDPVSGRARFFARQDEVYLTTDTNTVVIDLSDPQTPRLHPFYLQKTPQNLYNIQITNREQREGEGFEVGLYAQAVILRDGQLRSVAPVSDRLMTVRVKDPTDLDASALTTVRLELARLDPALTGATHIHFFTTRPSANVPEDTTDLLSVVPDAYMELDTTHQTNFAYNTTFENRESDFIPAGEQITFRYLATNEFRAYAAEAESHKVYFSYYDPAKNISLFRNFTDVVPLGLEGGEITGLHFLRDTFLYVYTTNQIQVIATDPIAELHRVVDYIKPRGDKGEIIGCAAPDTIVNIVGRHYFLATNQRVYRFDGQRLYDISDRVHAAFQKVLTPTEEGRLQIQDAIGYSVDENYVVSVNMVLPDAEQADTPNRLLVYDVTHGVWWHDSYGVHAVTKGVYDTIYGVMDGRLYLLHWGATDDGAAIRRIWRGHPYQTATQKTWESVHIHPLEPCRVDITASTEQDEFVGYVDIRNIAAFDEKRMGCNLRGAVQTVEIQTESVAAIHRIAVNERPRNR